MERTYVFGNGGWIRKMWPTCTTDIFPARKKNKAVVHTKQMQMNVISAKWIKSVSEKQTLHIVSHLCLLGFRDTWGNICPNDMNVEVKLSPKTVTTRVNLKGRRRVET